jgi:hypothetical protein
MGEYKETPAQRKERERWEAEDDLRTLQRADEIKRDPKRLKRAEKHAKKVANIFDST